MRRLLQRFLALESASGIVLLFATAVAIFWANSPWASLYIAFQHQLLFLINEVLMAVFFLVVGLELKRGYLSGQLATFAKVALPSAAALGGMLLPALIYLFINKGNSATQVGWSIPVATDIAFAVGVLTLFGSRIPPGLKLFLLLLAIFDDIGAILIIAFFYSHGVLALWLIVTVLLMTLLLLLNQQKVHYLPLYLLIGVGIWFSLFYAGVHPTLSGVLVALMIPGEGVKAPLEGLENTLHPWSAFFIMPLFALANAGLSFAGVSWLSLTDVVALGIILGLFVGKQLGVFGFSWLMIRAGLASLPEKTTWLQLYGVALLCGIGFTMSLFLGTLSFQNNASYLSDVRLGVMAGSLLSGLFGALVLSRMSDKKRKEKHR